MTLPEITDNSYDWEKRIEIVKLYLITGSRRKTAEMAEISLQTLDRYRDQPWWDEVVAEIKKQRDSKVVHKLSSIVERALEVVEDRLENGDIVLNNKTGTLVRKPVPLREASKAAVELLARQQQIEKQADEATVQQSTVKETLGLLAAEFSKWSKQVSKSNAQVIDFTERKTNALHDQWQEGLQEGSGEVHFQTGSQEEASGTERSETGNDERG